MLPRVIAGLVLSCVLGTAAFAGWKEPRESLDQTYSFGNFRIFYTLNGPNAFPDRADDVDRRALAQQYLEALTRQLSEADVYFRSTLGLRAPIAGLRYRRVTSIDIHILHLQDKFGSTGDEIQVFRYKHFEHSPAALTITLSNRWRPGNNTPAHELFHVFQYGYTLFKTPWFLEGMARSNEKLSISPPDKTYSLPRSIVEIRELAGRSYGAAPLWKRIAEYCGVRIFGSVLSAYERIDQEISRARGLEPHAWPEEEQRSGGNTPYLLRGLLKALDDDCAGKGGSELNAFKVVLRAGAAGVPEGQVNRAGQLPR